MQNINNCKFVQNFIFNFLSWECSAQGQVLNCKRRNLGCSLPKAGLSPQTQETRLPFYQGLNRCGSFPLPSAPHSLFRIWKDLKRSVKIPRGTNVEVMSVDLANWALRTSPKFSTPGKNISSIMVFHQIRDPGIPIIYKFYVDKIKHVILVIFFTIAYMLTFCIFHPSLHMNHWWWYDIYIRPFN